MTLLYQILTLLGSVMLFLFGLGLLSGGLQKVAGDGLRTMLGKMISNPAKQILSGIGVTAVIQSSTATTIMIVSFVNAGLLVLGQAIGVIMGAHIGTTITSWIMALSGAEGGFNIADYAYIMVLIGFLLTKSKKNQQRKQLGEVIIGFALFFIGFQSLRLTSGAMIGEGSLRFLESWTNLGVIGGTPVGSIALFLLIGVVLTVCFQSSAATMGIIMALVMGGVIPFRLAAAMILGENIGTTIAANIAASVGNTNAKRTAISHTIMNTFGVCWVLCIFPWFLKMVGWVVSTLFGLPDPNTADLSDASNAAAMQNSLVFSVCTMHTLFNVVNTLILVWFIPLIAKLCCKIFPGKPEEEDQDSRLQFIHGGPLSTAELSLDLVNQEIVHFGEVCYKDLLHVREAINETDPEKLEERIQKLIKYEQITDKVEGEIAAYLNEVSKGDISAVSASRIKATYKIIGEMESVGDTAEAIGRILRRKQAHGKIFDVEMIRKLNSMLDYVDAAFQAMLANLRVPYSSVKDISNAQSAEYNINEYRNTLREEHINNIENAEYNYQTGVYYIDIVAELEQMGDFIINISEALVEENEKK